VRDDVDGYGTTAVWTSQWWLPDASFGEVLYRNRVERAAIAARVFEDDHAPRLGRRGRPLEEQHHVEPRHLQDATNVSLRRAQEEISAIGAKAIPGTGQDSQTNRAKEGDAIQVDDDRAVECVQAVPEFLPLGEVDFARQDHKPRRAMFDDLDVQRGKLDGHPCTNVPLIVPVKVEHRSLRTADLIRSGGCCLNLVPL
jgi:hypothetical protein